jgi:hypothetical protein
MSPDRVDENQQQGATATHSRRRWLSRALGIAVVARVPCPGERESAIAVALGSRAHLTVQSQFKSPFVEFFSSTLGCGPPAELRSAALSEPILAFRFPGGGSLSVEFSPDAPDDRQLRRGAWLELRTDNVGDTISRVLAAGAPQVIYAATSTFYFAAPGGQVFGIVADQKR